MSPNSVALRILLAPHPNYREIPTINVCSHEVPLPAYWKVMELLELGKKEDQIIHVIVQESGTRTQRVVTDIVRAIADNQRRMEGLKVATPTKSNRLSTFLTKRPKRVSMHRASQVEAHRDLEVAESRLHNAKRQEKQLLSTAMALARRKENLNDAGRRISPEEKRKTISAIDHEIRMTLQRHAEIETELEYAKRLTLVHKATPT